MKFNKKNLGRSKFVFAGWLIDGTGKPVRKNVMIKIHDGKFVEINQVETGLESLRQKAEVDLIDFSEYTVLPALVDSHVHLFMSGTQEFKVRQKQLEAGFEEIRPVISEHIHRHLDNGIVAVRDGGDHQGHAMRYKEQCFELQNMPIYLKVAGKAWKRQGRYGKLIGRSPEKGETLAMAIQRDLTGLYPQKPDHIKIVNSGINSLINFGKPTLPQFDSEELKDAIEVAADHDLSVMVHANGDEPVRLAVEAGCRSIEHGFFMGKDNLKRMADQGTFWVPTACTMKGYAETLGAESPEAIAAQRYLDHQVEQMALGKSLGVTMAVGTDAGSMGVHHGRAVLEELKLFVRAGFCLEEAICCASGNGAALLGIKRAGSISVSKEASFIAVKGSPAVLPENFEKNRIVFIKGAKCHL
jgi:imidazolonepropionase-like amidohydrolase